MAPFAKSLWFPMGNNILCLEIPTVGSEKFSLLGFEKGNYSNRLPKNGILKRENLLDATVWFPMGNNPFLFEVPMVGKKGIKHNPKKALTTTALKRP